MPIPPNVMEYGAYGVILFCFVALAWRGVPAFKAWLDKLLTTHKEAINAILADSTANRQSFDKTLGIYRDEHREREQALIKRMDDKDQQIIDILRGKGQ
jgi:hypothetical protein